jgi:hypothetical protein
MALFTRPEMGLFYPTLSGVSYWMWKCGWGIRGIEVVLLEIWGRGMNLGCCYYCFFGRSSFVFEAFLWKLLRVTWLL